LRLMADRFPFPPHVVGIGVGADRLHFDSAKLSLELALPVYDRYYWHNHYNFLDWIARKLFCPDGKKNSERPS
jgi:hypothetical protein